MTTRTPNVFRDPIVEEVRKTKLRLAERYNYDVKAMLKVVQKQQTRSGHKIVAAAARERQRDKTHQ